MPELKKDLTLYGLTMVAIGSCIGSGIFLTPAQIAEQLPSPILILLVWAIGGLMAISGALTFAELGARYPQAGGIYAFLREAYGDVVGFMYGWATFLVVNTGAIAALSLAFASYLAFIIPMDETLKKIVAIAAIISVTLFNIYSVKMGELFSNVFTGLKLIGIAAIILIGLFLGSADTNDFSMSTVESDFSVTAIGLALIGVIFSYGGFQHASFLAGEAKNARRNIPRSMVIGSSVVCIVYLLTNLAYLYLLPVAELTQSEDVAARAITSVYPGAGVFIALIIAISCLGTAGIYTLTSPRIYFAMASDRIFFAQLAKIHPTYKTPVNAIVSQSVWAIVLVLFWGTFADLIVYVLFTDWIFLTMAAISIFIFRFNKQEESSYKAFGYPLTPIVFIGLSLFLVINTLIEKPEQAGAGLLFLVIGLPVYIFFKRRTS
ncbi:MAG TPA: amino acid permease [Flavobacteriales bacterium]|nr:amino acid permease [Flavobacteriales bacterium]HIO72554.1 amino acid permease [Flavobacteriales bacterium]